MGKVHTNRKLVCMTAAGFFLALLSLDGGTLASQWRQVRWVDDGDTVVLSDGTRVRYIGINAPEIAHEDRPAERFGPEARAFNRKLVDQKMARLELDRERQDQYGRLLAYIFLQDGTLYQIRSAIAPASARGHGKEGRAVETISRPTGNLRGQRAFQTFPPSQLPLWEDDISQKPRRL